MRLSELAFADLMALGWEKPKNVYMAVFSQEAKFMSDEKIKATANALAKREDIRVRVSQTEERIAKKFKQSNVNLDSDDNEISGKADRMRQLQSIVNSTDDPKVKIQAIEKLAVLAGDKKDTVTGKDDPVRFYLPQKCSGCNLFIEACRVGFVKYDDGSNVPVDVSKKAIFSLASKQQELDNQEQASKPKESDASSSVTFI